MKRQTRIALYGCVSIIILGFLGFVLLWRTNLFAASIPKMPGTTKLENLSSSDVYVGNCCKGYQIAYHIPRSMSEVRDFYEHELGTSFEKGGHPLYPNFKDYSIFPSSEWSYVCKPSCDDLRATHYSIFLLDSNDLLDQEGTVVILQVQQKR